MQFIWFLKQLYGTPFQEGSKPVVWHELVIIASENADKFFKYFVGKQERLD